MLSGPSKKRVDVSSRSGEIRFPGPLAEKNRNNQERRDFGDGEGVR